MLCQPDRTREVQRMSAVLTPLLLPPVKRHRGEQPDPTLRMLEKNIQRGTVKTVEHSVTVLVGRIDRGEPIESVTRYVRALDRALRAYAARRTPPPDVGALLLRMQAEIGEAAVAALRFTGQPCAPSRASLLREVDDVRVVADQVALAAERERQESAA